MRRSDDELNLWRRAQAAHWTMVSADAASSVSHDDRPGNVGTANDIKALSSAGDGDEPLS
jgi:hypothetical protein